MGGMDKTLDVAFDWVTDPVVITVFSIVFATLLTNFIARRLFDRIEIKVKDTETLWDDAVLRSVRRPFSLMIWVIGVSWAAEILASQGDSALSIVIDPARYVLVVGLIAMFLTRFVRELEQAFIQRGSDVTTVTAIGKLARISVLITAGLSVLQTLGVSISGILAFGGIGGIAVGFAAKDLLANFFGGLMIYLDRPFKVGDWIRSPDRDIEGTVVDIGWRLTEIRTFDQRPVYVPNSVFATIALENPSRMLNRRIYETIGVRYDDIDKVEMIVSDVKQMLLNHAAIDTSRTLIVNFNAFNASSLDFFVYTFTKTTNWVEYHEIKQEVLLKISSIIAEHEAEIAYPTRTLHIVPEPSQ